MRVFLPGQSRSRTQPPKNAGRRKDDLVYTAHRGKTLIVEDQTEVRSQIADTLNEVGYMVIEAGDGMAGLKVLESGEPLDLLITDVGLPGLSGLQLAEAAHAMRPNLPILLITGYAGNSLGTWKLASNMEVLRKPFTLDELAARVQGLLKGTA